MLVVWCGGVGTLLGPEGTRQGAPCSPGCGGGGVRCFFWCGMHATGFAWLGGVGGVVCVLFENCIVDASILFFCVFVNFGCCLPVVVGGGQVFKGARWMPWHQEPMKAVVICDKPRGVDKRADPRVAEWGNPAGVMSSHLHLNV